MTTPATTEPNRARSGAGAMDAPWWRRHGSVLWISLGVVAALAVALVTAGRTSADPLDPDNPGRAGAQALARVLSDQGVDVHIVRSVGAVEDLRPQSRDTVVVTSTNNLGTGPLARLSEATASAQLILVQPGLLVTDEFDLPPGGPTYESDARRARCTSPALEDLLGDLTITSSTTSVDYPAEQGCFPGTAGSLVAQPQEGLLLLGGADILTNSEILKADNAAAGLRLLGQSDRLVWYVPNPQEALDTDTVTLQSLLPTWLRPGLWILAFAMLGVVLWQGRRLGRLAVEPLPVVVRAIETTRSRGRLYRKANDRGHAATQLRHQTRRALARHLRLPASGPVDHLIAHVAQRTGRTHEAVGLLLSPTAPAPRTDQDLISLAGELATLEKEVRRS